VISVGKDAHVGSIAHVLDAARTDLERGLTPAEAAARLTNQGPNELPVGTRKSTFARIVAQFANPIVLTLLVAALIAVATGSGGEGSFLARYGDAIAIFLIVTLNAGLGFYQERRAEIALEALKRMQAPTARVVRDGRLCELAGSEVVVGDIIELEAGDAIPADARVVQAIDLATLEAALTGESAPIGKDAHADLEALAPIGDRRNMLFVGTHVVRGKGRAVVTSTGARTELGRLSLLMQQGGEIKTPLEERLDRFGKQILVVCLALSVLLFCWGLYVGEKRWHALLLEAVSVAVAAIPEGLPAITTITLALGTQRMAKRGAIIRKLAAVETLGSATVICSDKTGTLTQNEMTVRELYAGGALFTVSGEGYAPIGTIARKDNRADGSADPIVREMAETSALCNNARLEESAGTYRVIGDPTEGALLTLAGKVGVRRDSLLPKPIRELPFDSDRKRMTVVTLDERGRAIAHSKGSCDVLLPLCTHEQLASGAELLTSETRAAIMDAADEMSRRALRVLAFARRETPDANGDVEEKLTFLGLVGMIDPPRPGVFEAVRKCADAHVRAVMITGDHKLTAVAIARELGLWDEGAIAISGSELELMSDSDLADRVNYARVFARVTAEQKLRIVKAFKARGHVVAMTGDGVNDAPALREAHIGIAMGRDGTDVAREAADMVLADDNFATIVEAIREGRAIYRNIQKFIFFLLSANAGLLFCVFFSALFPKFLGLRPLMILWINLVTNGLPALALGVDPPDEDQMSDPPRKLSEGLVGKRELLGIALVGVVMGTCGVACYLVPWELASGVNAMSFARAAAFSLLALSPLFHALNCRSPTRSFLLQRPVMPLALLAGLTVSALIHMVTIVVPGLRPVFATYALSLRDWGILLALSALIIPVIEVLKLLQRTGIVARDLGPLSKMSRANRRTP
jgi:P-type Ca2+ transporter type 2C